MIKEDCLEHARVWSQIGQRFQKLAQRQAPSQIGSAISAHDNSNAGLAFSVAEQYRKLAESKDA